ncbi:hypothetical protein FLP41_03595 (plasmid) [Paracoccus marcusii]|nr:hypothetical protein FLP41_03595 [Paracoccus marcusii]
MRRTEGIWTSGDHLQSLKRKSDNGFSLAKYRFSGSKSGLVDPESNACMNGYASLQEGTSFPT